MLADRLAAAGYLGGLRSAALALVSAAVGLGAGFFAVGHTKTAVVLVAAVALLGIVARSPVALACLALPASFDTSRLSLGNGISLPDVVLLGATFLSFPALARSETPKGLFALRRWFLAYAAAMLIASVAHPRYEGFIEIGHRALLVLGAAGVGVWIYDEGRARVALRLAVAAATVLGVAAVIAGAAHGFHHPAQPFGFQKNFVGTMLGLSGLLVLAGSDELALAPPLRSFCILFIAGGLAASQSRLAMVSFGIGILAWALGTKGAAVRRAVKKRRVSVLAVVISIGFLVFAGILIKDQLAHKQASKTTNSVAVRNQIESATRAYWRQSPIIGNGVYYYYHNPSLQAQNSDLVAPNNSIDEALAEGGVVEAAAFVTFLLGGMWVLWRSRRYSPLALVGLAMVLDRVVHGMGDIYWTAGDASLPWIVAGMGLAQAAHARLGHHGETASEEPQSASRRIAAA